MSQIEKMQRDLVKTQNEYIQELKNMIELKDKYINVLERQLDIQDKHIIKQEEMMGDYKQMLKTSIQAI